MTDSHDIPVPRVPDQAALAAAQQRIQGAAIRTPLLKLHWPESSTRIYLKPENLQPIGSFKLRGAVNAVKALGDEATSAGIYTASAGNMAQGVAWAAAELGVPCSVVVPDHAPTTKLEAVKRLGGRIIPVPFDAWWDVMMSGRYAGLDGAFVHPVWDFEVIAGNGTVGLEIHEDLADADTVIVPYGGGGLSCGIAAALRACGSRARVLAAEVETAAPLKAALQAGHPVQVDYQPSFVDGIGSKGVLGPMWPLARDLIADSIVVSLDEIRGAIAVLAERQRMIAEGAGAAALAAALSGRAGEGKVVCVISGGNIDTDVLKTIL